MDNTANHSEVVVGTHNDNEKAGIPATTGIPASKPADYGGNFGLRSGRYQLELHVYDASGHVSGYAAQLRMKR